MKFVIASHVGFVKNKETFGLASHIARYVHSHHLEYVYLKHCLVGETPSQLELSNGKLQFNLSKHHQSNVLIRSFEHILINIRHVQSYKDNEIFFIGVDPVNSLAGAILKLLGKIKYNVFLCADYADRRYNSPFLNMVYHGIDKIALRFADEVWCVSSRIITKRAEQGVPKRKLKLLPNSPNFEDVKRIRYDGNKRMVVVTHFNKSFDLKQILSFLEELNRKKIQIGLDIIGFGPEEQSLRRLVQSSTVGRSVRFLGRLDHEAVMKTIARSFLGIALYTNENPWNWYGDSMKAREYAAAGIPLIINSIPSTSDEVRKYKAGLVIDNTTDQEDIVAFIVHCARNRKYYSDLKKKALELGKSFDKKTILDHLFRKYI